MAQRRKNTASAKPSAPQLTVDEKRQMYEKAKEAAKQLYNPSKKTSSNIAAYTRESIRNYIQRPANNEENLRKASRYYYYRSQALYRIVNWYAGMWILDCRKVTPNVSLVKSSNDSKLLKSFQNTLDELERYDLQNNFKEVAINCYLYDVCYAIFFHDDTGAFFYIMEPSECKLIGRYLTQDMAYAVDMSKWSNSNRQEMLEWLGEPLKSMWDEYQRTGEKWIAMPDEYCACFKFNSSDLNYIIPPIAPLLQQLAGMSDMEDIQALLNESLIRKLLVLPMETRNNADGPDDFKVSPDMLIAYHEILKEVLPDYVSSAVVPGELKKENVIDFSSVSADNDLNYLLKTQDTFFTLSGGGAVLNSSKINSSVAFSAWLREETNFAISSLLGQIQGFTNRMLSYNVSNPCKVTYFNESVYTREDLAERLLKACQYSFADRLAYNTAVGVSEKETMAMLHFEQEVLKLPGIMVNPLSSSFTQSGESEDIGRPTVDDGEISDSGERSRNA